MPLSLTKHYLRAPSFAPALQPLFFSGKPEKHAETWQLASVTQPIQTTSTLTQLITHTPAALQSSIVQYTHTRTQTYAQSASVH